MTEMLVPMKRLLLDIIYVCYAR